MTQSILTFHGRLVLWGDTSTCLPIRGLSTHLNDQRTVTVFVLENVLTSPMRVFSRLEIRNLQVCSRHVWTDGPIDLPVSVWKQTWLVSVFFFCVWAIWRGFLMCRQGETTDALWWICLKIASCFKMFCSLICSGITEAPAISCRKTSSGRSWCHGESSTHVALRYVVRVAVDFLFTMIIYINIHADGSDERQWIHSKLSAPIY